MPNTRVGTAGELTLVIHMGPVRFTALPRALGGSFELHATLAPPYARPRVTVPGKETRFRVTGLAQASALLLNEPTYRSQVLATNATHVGVGVAKSAGGEWFVAID